MRHQQQALDNEVLQNLLRGTVRDLHAEIPGLGETASTDVKHIYAWVQANNPKAYVAGRYDPAQQPRGDPDCRLGVKRRHNQELPAGSAPERKEYVWGYGTGIAAATHPVYGDVVLAEVTHPFNESDVTYFQPVRQRTTSALGFPPKNWTADAAYDAWYVYQAAAEQGGLAAIPLNSRGHPLPQLDSHGLPLCPHQLSMFPSYHYAHPDGYQAQVLRCPLLFPVPTGQPCDHEQFRKGPGCVKHINLELGGRMRLSLDRQSDTYKALYKQRTAAERINSQAVAFGIERPRVRNIHSLRNLNTLTYLVINARALRRVRQINARSPVRVAPLC